MKKYVAVFLSLLSLFACAAPALAAAEAGPSARSSAAEESGALPAIEPIRPIEPAAPPESAPTQPTQSAPVSTQPIVDPIEPIPAPVEPIVDPMENTPAASAGEDADGSGSYQRIVRQSGRGTVTDLYQYWEEHGYPDDVAYAYQAGGELVGNTAYSWWEIGLVDGSEARQNEILDLAAPTCLVEFKKALFPHAEKAAAYQTLLEMAKTDEAILQVVFPLNDDTVWVAVPEERAKEYARYLIRDCGLGAVVSVTDEDSLGAVTDGDTLIAAPTGDGLDAGLVPETGAAAVSPAIWAGLAAAVGTAVVCAALALRSTFTRTAVTAEGRQLPSGAPLSRRQAEQLVRDGVRAPDAAVYRSILRGISSGEQTGPRNDAHD